MVTENIKVDAGKIIQAVEVEKIRFLVWFTGALVHFNGLQAHHLTTVRTYFQDLGLGDPETAETYDKGLIKFGYNKKTK